MKDQRILTVLAGGAGRRFDDQGGDLPKCLAHVGDDCLVMSGVRQVVEEIGVSHTLFRIAHRPSTFFDFWQKGKLSCATPSLLVVGGAKDGPIGALVDTIMLVGGDITFFLGGDVFFRVRSFRAALDFHNAHSAPLTICVAPSVPAVRPSTLVMGADNSLASFSRKPETDTNDLINAGFYIVEPRGVDWLLEDYRRHIDDIPTNEYKEDHLWHLVKDRPDRARLFELEGVVVNVNTKRQLEYAQQVAAQRLRPPGGASIRKNI